MRKRTRSREFALQILYQIDVSSDNYDAALANLWQAHSEENIGEEINGFTAELVSGVAANLSAIDAKISQYAANKLGSKTLNFLSNILFAMRLP